MNNFPEYIFDENGDYIVEATILDNFSESASCHYDGEKMICVIEEIRNSNQTNKLNNFEEFDISDLDYSPESKFTFDDVEDDDLDYETHNFIEKNISLLDYLDEDLADMNMLNIVLTNTMHIAKKRKRE